MPVSSVREQPLKIVNPPAGAAEGDGVGVVHLVAEYWPFARTGGLAEAVRGIAGYQAASNVPTAVFMPYYRSVREAFPDIAPLTDPFVVRMGNRQETARLFQTPGRRGEPRVLFVDHPGYFDRDGIYGTGGADYPDNVQRFSFFAMAVLRVLPELALPPAVLHSHDWHTALAPVYLRTVFGGQPYYDRLATVLSVHNAGFQGHFGPETLAEIGLPNELFHWKWMEWYGRVNWLKGGLVFSEAATTVSPTHAHELRTPAGGFGLHQTFISLADRFIGILNGIDLSIWDPETDRDIVARYSADDLSGKTRCKAAVQQAYGLPQNDRTPLFGMTARLVAQKGIDLLLEDDFLLKNDAQFVFLGAGEERYESALSAVAERAPDRVAVDTAFTEHKEHVLLAGADFLLMPSLYEPCGLTQMRAQRYGAIPVARRVGGLADTIEDQITGFLFDDYSAGELHLALQRALLVYEDEDSWQEHQREAMGRDFGWERSAEKYLGLYRQILASRAASG
jgi:starch synthase